MEILTPSHKKLQVGPYNYSSQSLHSGRAFKERPKYVTVEDKKYNVLDGEATKFCKEVAKALGVEFKDSWFTDRIAQAILENVRGEAYQKPKRGVRQTVFNYAIFDGILILHEYKNDGLGASDSITKNCYVYK